MEQVQSLSLSPPLTSSTALPGPLTDPAPLQETRALLGRARDFLGAEDARDWEAESLATYRLTLAGDGWEATYRLLPPAGATTDPWTYVLAQDAAGRVTGPPVAALPFHPEALAALLRQQEHSGNDPPFLRAVRPAGPPLSAPPGPAGGAVFHTLSIFESIWGASCVSCPFFPGAAPAFLHFAPLRNR